MNYYLTSQLVAERQATLAQLKNASSPREATAASASQPTRTRRLFLGRPSPATA